MKLLGHSLSKTQTRAALVSAAAGIALLVIAIAGMRKGATAAAATDPTSDALNTAFKQGYNTGASDAESRAPIGPWDMLPSASRYAPAIGALVSDPGVAPASTRSSIAAADVAPVITIATGPAPAAAPAVSYPTAVELAREPIGGWTAPPMFQQTSPTVVVDTSGGKDRPGSTGAVNPANRLLGYADPKTGALSPTPNGGAAIYA